MKRIKLLSILICVAVSSYAQNIPNRSFERWKNDTIFEDLTEWTTTNQEFRGTIEPVVEKSNDAFHGNHSLLLQNAVINNGDDSVFAYAFLGSVGENGPDGGIAYTADIDSVTGWYKCDTKGSDSAMILVIQFNSTDTTYSFFFVGGLVNDWTRFSFPLPNQTNDEIFIGVVSSNPFDFSNYHAESWIMFDKIQFTSTSSTPPLLPDYSFEDWYFLAPEVPDVWTTTNVIAAIFGDELPVSKTTDAYAGDYAIKIKSTYQTMFDDTVGVVLASPFPDGGGLPGAFPFKEVPTSLSGYYKYFPANSADTAMIGVVLTKWDGSNSVEVRAAYRALTAENNYTAFTIDIDTSGLTTDDFDSVNIVIVSSMYAFSGGAPYGSELYIDELWLDSKCAYADTTEIWEYNSITKCNWETIIIPNYEDYVSFLWENGDTIHFSSDFGDRILTVTDTNGCQITDDLLVIEDFCGSVKTALNKQITIFPNPTSSSLNINFGDISTTEPKTIRLTNILGTVIYTKIAQHNTEVIDLSRLPRGIYFIDIGIGEEQATYKVVRK